MTVAVGQCSVFQSDFVFAAAAAARLVAASVVLRLETAGSGGGGTSGWQPTGDWRPIFYRTVNQTDRLGCQPVMDIYT